MSANPKPRAPAALGPAGRVLWKRIIDAFDLDSAEQAILEVACRQADDLAQLERIIADDGMVVRGSAGQPRLNGAVPEARQARLAVGKLLGSLALPSEDERPMTAASRTAQHAANVRWDRTRRQRAARASGAP